MLIFLSDNPFEFRLRVLTIICDLWPLCQFSKLLLCCLVLSHVWHAMVNLKLGWCSVPLFSPQNLCVLLRVRSVHRPKVAPRSSWTTLKGCFSKLLHLQNTPDTFQIPENPLFGPLDRKLGVYLTHCVVYLLISSSGTKWWQKWIMGFTPFSWSTVAPFGEGFPPSEF